ncbi:glycoside hydrolase family 3 N-terminal domain-containing protein [Paractinoplanes durhamensis]|uniref:beta-glucosidase n=1 Tax=Paractinoplanes durhamensis TaxID=113563 RepID=A0ABQ3Z5B3_9ACTN|nr:glycoside hydrolase family 3 N-terminal domain-containing protein [Actinoplanes durhamensis]GIE05027.1 beta-glucosidase [Actinoplanes durhamensis]
MRAGKQHTAGVLAALLVVTAVVVLRADDGEVRPAAAVARSVDELLARMTLDDKIGQMTQAERAAVTPAQVAQYRLGSVLSGGGSAPDDDTPAGWADMYDAYQRGALATPLKIPMIYGVDAVHGNNNVPGSTLFPHNIGLGATRDPDLVRRIGEATAEEVTGAGPDWTFAPCLCVARDDRWGRTYESFGEDPAIATSMTTVITGLQDGPAPVLATAKHYLGDGGTTGGDDQGDTELSEADLRRIHLPPFQAAVDRGVGSVMISFSSWNGVKAHADKFLITDLLKNELGFTGFTVSDWAGIDQIDGERGFTRAEVVTAVNAGLDMLMVPENWPTFIGYLRAAVEAGEIPMSRIDDANRRILTQKFKIGLFEKPYADRSFTPTVGSAAHRELARQAVRESQVLLRNSGVLPLAKNGGKVFVAGKSADDLGNQAGGWTTTWQGSSGATYPGGTTILQGIRDVAGSGTTVTYDRAGDGIDGTYRAAIAVIGETPYAEYEGDRPGGLGLDDQDTAVLAKLRAAGVPVIVVLVSGRPMDVGSLVAGWDAFVAAWLPGSEGAGVADVLFGDYAPTGRLPVTWPATSAQEPINDGPGLYAYGYGLSFDDREADTAPPSAPGTPSATALRLSWMGSTDTGGSGLDGYDVLRDGGLIGTTTAAAFAVPKLSPGVHELTVVARDKAGNRSAPSSPLVVTVPDARGCKARDGTPCAVT